MAVIKTLQRKTANWDTVSEDNAVRRFYKDSTDSYLTTNTPKYIILKTAVAGADFRHTYGGLVQNKDGTSRIKVDGTQVASWSTTDDWASRSTAILSYFSYQSATGRYTIAGDVTYHSEPYNQYSAGKIKNNYITWTYECPYVTVNTNAGTGGTVSGAGTIDIEAPGASYSKTVTATPSANYHFVRWDFSDGRASSTNSSYQFTYSDALISAHATTVTATAVFAKNPRVYVKAIATDGGTVPGTFLSGSDTSTDAFYTFGQTASKTSIATCENNDRSSVYAFTGWKIYKGNTTSGTAVATSSSASHSYTFTASNYTDICDANGETSWVAQYERRFFVEVTKPTANATYTVKNMSGTAIASSGDGLSSSVARYAVPSTGCRIYLTFDSRWALNVGSSGVASGCGTFSWDNSGACATVVPNASRSTAPVTLAYRQIYWQLTVSGNAAYSANYDGATGKASYDSSTNKLYAMTMFYNGTTYLYGNGTWLIPVDAALHIQANDDTGYDATVSVDGVTRLSPSYSSGRNYTISAGTSDHTVAITQTQAVRFACTTSIRVDGDEISGVSYGTFALSGDVENGAVLRHGSVYATFSAGSGYALARMEHKSDAGTFWENDQGANPCVILNVVEVMNVRATVEVDSQQTFNIVLTPPRYGHFVALYVTDNTSSDMHCYPNSSPVSYSVRRGVAATLQLQALFADNGDPYAFCCSVQRGNTVRRYRVSNCFVSYAGDQQKMLNSPNIALPVGENVVVTVSVAYRKNRIYLPIDETGGVTGTVTRRNVRPKSLHADNGSSVRNVSAVYADVGVHAPECVWEAPDANAFGEIPRPAMVTATDSSSPTTEKASNLFDGHYTAGDHTKWYCGMPNNGTAISVVCDAGIPRFVDAYTLVTANDTATYPDRNPKDWRILGSDDCATWVELHAVTNDTTLQAANYTPYTFYIYNATPFRYYKLEISRTGGSGMQLAEWILGDNLLPLPANGLRTS